MDGREFLAVALRLSREQTEADWRTACGRAYYALLQEAKNSLERWGFVARAREEIHRFVRLRFIYAQEPDLKRIGQRIERLGLLRNNADYQLTNSGPFVSVTVVMSAIQNAQEAITLLDQIDGDPSRRAVAVAAIQAAFPP